MSNSGAFILDTILNFNDTKNSQVFPHDWADKIEGNVAEDIANNENKGGLSGFKTNSNFENFDGIFLWKS